MALHPGERKRHFPEEAPVAWDPIRRDLEENEDWYRDLVEHSQDLLCVHDLEGRFLSVNPVPARLLGYSVEELLRTPMREFIDPQFRKQFDEYLREIERTGLAHGLLALITRSGERLIWEYHSTLRTEGVPTPIVRGIAHDVTDRARAEQALRRTNEALRESAARERARAKELETVLDAVPVAVCIAHDAECRRMTGNRAAHEQLRVPAGQNLSKSAPLGQRPTFRLVDDGAEISTDLLPMQQAAATGKPVYGRELTLAFEDGTERETLSTAVPLLDEAGNPRGAVGASIDVTERKQAEKALRESELRFRTVYERSPVGISLVDSLTGQFLQVNPKFCEITGRSEEELLKSNVRSITHPDDVGLDLANLQQLAEEKLASYEMEKRYLRPDGSVRWVRLLVTPMWSKGDTRRWEMGLMEDITEQKRAEKALRESEQRFRAVYERAPVGIVLVDSSSGRILQVNPTFCAIVERSEEELLRSDVLSITHPDDVAQCGEYLRQLAEGRLDHCEIEKRYVRPDGSARWVRLQAVPMSDKGGARTWQMGLVQDITERKRAEEDLRASEERLRLALEVAKIGTFERNLQTGESRWSRETEAIYGLAPGEFPRSLEAFLELVHGEDRQYVARLVEQSMRIGDVEGEWRVVWPDGTLHWIAGRWRIFKDEQGRPLRALGMDFDITARKQMDEALRETERRRQQALQIGKIGAFELDVESGIGTWTTEVANIWGIPEGFAGNLNRFCWERAHPDDVERIRREFEQLVRSHKETEMEFRLIRPDGVLRWIRWSGQVLQDETTGRMRVAGVNVDITERKHEEEAIASLVQVRANSSENFFASMAGELAKCLDADYTIIGELIEGEENTLRTIGVWGQGAIANNFTRDLADTPCGTVVQQGTCSYVAGVTERFPRDFLLKQMKVEGYAGTSLRDSQGRVIGIMVALYTRPLVHAKLAETILQLFSARTAANIERMRTEEALRQSEERFRVALKHSPISVFSQDRDLRYTWMYNPQLPGLASDRLGKTPNEFFGSEDGERITEIRNQVLETGAGSRREIQITDGGKKRYFDTTIEPLMDSAGAVIGLIGASTDVTELRETTEALREAKKKLTEEKLYLEQEIDTELGFGEIIGKSKALQTVMENVGKVAASEATVLLLGETGTGKELVARAIHRLSRRAGNSFIKLNCAAIPSGLLESELFGNEKGAFTGAVSRKIGRLELADKGTLFLDEIGEISLASQPKLLRVLQDQEFERLGGTQTLKVDFRLIAATNRDLADSVRENEFRSDLYYRLNVFPIRVPPLRERREDIQLLVEHFVQKFAQRMKKSITSIPTRTFNALKAWEWPGNIRELENFIERSVILTQGSVLVSPLSELQSMAAEEEGFDERLEATEREHILRALRESHGQIGGLKGAAMRLGLKRTTLQSKLKHLGINPRSGPTEP